MKQQRNTFLKGKMQKDLDIRLVPNGEMRDAMNIRVASSEGGDVGAVENVKGNELLSSLALTNAVTIGKLADPANEKLYYMVTSDNKDMVVEYDVKLAKTTIVLESSRPNGVLNFDRKFLITGIDKTWNDDPSKDLLIWTDDLNPIRKINIERAKTYGADNFEEEDISLIKSPPKYPPSIQLTYTPGAKENYLEDKFLTFGYFYKYLDGEYSALSTFSEAAFEPGNFALNFQTYENEGMVNSFNAVKINFNTGDKRVTDIILVYKQTNSNVPYIIQRFNKKEEVWGHNQTQSFVFSNNKGYIPLSSEELLRTFDNVPRLAKAFALAGNIPFFGNYVEGYDIKDAYGQDIKLDYDLSLQTKELNREPLPLNVIPGNNASGRISIDLTGVGLTTGSKLSFFIALKDTENLSSYSQDFEFILNDTYANVQALGQSNEFQNFVREVWTQDFRASYDGEPPTGGSIDSETEFSVVNILSNSIQIQAPQLRYQVDNTPTDSSDNNFSYFNRYFNFAEGSLAWFSSVSVDSSLKSNRSYEVVMVYQDKWGRSSTALDSKDNTLYIAPAYATKQNRIRVSVNHVAPYWADRYKFAIKQTQLHYETIYATTFYPEGSYRWVKIEGANKNKIKEGDTLIVKSDATGPLSDLVKCRVIELVEKPDDFLDANKDVDENVIYEPGGLYMKIRPQGFSMTFDPNAIVSIDENAKGGPREYKDDVQEAVDKVVTLTDAERYNFLDNNNKKRPVIFLNQFNNFDNQGNYTSDMPIGAASRVTIDIELTNDGDTKVKIELSKTARETYINFQQFWEAEIPTLGELGEYYLDYIFGRDADGALAMLIQGDYSGSDGVLFGINQHASKLYVKINIQTVEGLVIFETEPEDVETEIFYEVPQVFDIVNGMHQGNLANQTVGTSAKIELNAFNCYVQGNGVESYKIKDNFNANYLNIDSRPTSVSQEKYQEVRRIADITWGGAYVESSNINRLNVFNLATGNFYERIDKQYGPIQIMKERETDLVVWQEDKVSHVPFEKDILFGADGSQTVQQSTEVLGTPIAYHGDWGISNNPESLSSIDREYSWVDSKRQMVLRLTNNGIFPVSGYGMSDFFYDLLRENLNTKKVSEYDPFNRNLILSVSEAPVVKLPTFMECSGTFTASKFTGSHSITIQYGVLKGTGGINFEVGDAPVRFQINYNGTVFDSGFYGNTSYNRALNELGYAPVVGQGSGTLTFNKANNTPSTATLTIHAPLDAATFKVTGLCVAPQEITVISIIVNDPEEEGQVLTSRYKWLSSSYGSSYKNQTLAFDKSGYSLYDVQTGPNGTGSIPSLGSTIYLEAYEGYGSTAGFNLEEGDRLGYLTSSTLYSSSQIASIINQGRFVAVSQSKPSSEETVYRASFTYAPGSNENYLYLIWDYTKKNTAPRAIDDNIFTQSGQSVTYDVTANDIDAEGDALSVIIMQQPAAGSLVNNGDGTVTYTHNGSDVYNDSFKYKVNDGQYDSNVATVNIQIGLTCSEGIDLFGRIGVYEFDMVLGTSLGYTGITYNAFGLPDRFQLIYDGVVVADTKFVGDNLNGYEDNLLNDGPFLLDVYRYVGDAFELTGETRSVSVTAADIADDSAQYPRDGQGTLVFNKETTSPTLMKIRVTAPIGTTGWNILGICPVPEVPEEPEILGTLFRMNINGVVYDFQNDNAEGACNVVANTNFYHDGTGPDPQIGDRVFNDPALTSPFNGGNLYYGLGNGMTINILNDGRVNNIYLCQQV